MARWMRFKTSDDAGFGVLDGETVIVHEGDMFAAASPTGRTIARSLFFEGRLFVSAGGTGNPTACIIWRPGVI
jgi:hypothetical protein